MSKAVVLASPGYDYTDIDDVAARKVRAITDRIRKKGAMIGMGILSIGADLIDVKDTIGRGNFVRWLAAEFSMSERSAQRYMQAAAVLRDESDTVSVLPPTTIYALSAKSTPDEVRGEIIAKLKAGEAMTDDAIGNKIAAARQHANHQRTLAKLKGRKRRNYANMLEEAEAREERHAAQLAKRKTAEAALVSYLSDRLKADFPKLEALFRAAGWTQQAQVLHNHGY